MAFDTEAKNNPDIGIPGCTAVHQEGKEVITLVASTDIPTQRVLSRNETAQAVLGTAASDKVVGVSIEQTFVQAASASNQPTSNGTVGAGGDVACQRKGQVTITAPADVNPTMDVLYTTATGEFAGTSGATTSVLTGATYESVALAGDPVNIRL